MRRLTGRLQMIADRIETGETMADIGCDHGFLPIYLRLTGKSPKVVVADVSAPSLAKAVSNAQLYGFQIEERLPPHRFVTGGDAGMDGELCEICSAADLGSGMHGAVAVSVKDAGVCRAGCASRKDDPGMDFRIGNGLSVLAPGEVDAVVIAGMGGKLIRDIMAADIGHTCSFKRFVLQPRIGQGYLRKWLLTHGFIIIGEDLVVEGTHIAEIITVISPGWTKGDCVSVPLPDAFSGESKHNSGGSAAVPAGTETAIGGDGADAGGFRAMHAGLPVVRMTQNGADAQGSDMIWKIPPWIIHAQGPVLDFLMRSLEAEQRKLSNVIRAKMRDLRLERAICHDIDYLKGLIKEYEEEHEDGQQ